MYEAPPSAVIATLALRGGARCQLVAIDAALPESELLALAHQIAAMEPWCRYPTYTVQQLARYLATGSARTPRLLIRDGSTPMGVAGLVHGWLRGPYVQTLAVLPAHQGRGVGAAVLGWLEGEARAAGERNLFVLASDFNTRALAFYERCGFARVVALEDLVADGFTEVLLRKRIA